MMKISAAICTRDRSALLEKAIQSLIDQTLTDEDYEILVVDNASTDNTRQVACQGFPHAKNSRYTHNPEIGVARSRNKAWQSAKGNYIAFLDDDAVAAPDWLERIVDVFEKGPEDLAFVGEKGFGKLVAGGGIEPPTLRL